MKNYIVILLLIFGCAYQGAPGGGPKDIKGPEILNVSPLNETVLSGFDKVIISFNEDINPTSLINSIDINQKIEFSTVIKGKKIIIKPLEQWPKDIPIEINLNRNLSDFHNNMINENIQLIYNIGSNKYCSINGLLYNQRLNKQYTIFAYDESENFIKKVNVNTNNSFNINYLEYGNYIIVASESNIEPFINDNYYGVSTELVALDLNDCMIDVSIYIDEPLQKLSINKVETVNSKLLNIIYDNNTSYPYIVESNIEDSIFINISNKNRLFEYSIEPYLYLIEGVVDTILPTIDSVENLDSLITINFSEPIISSKVLMFGQKNEEWIGLVDYKSPSLMSINIENKSFSKIKVFGNSVEDFSGNVMLDSMITYELDNSVIANKELSVLKGEINNYKDQNIVVEAKNISLNLIYRQLLEDSTFIFNDLEPGKYILRAYESKNQLDPLIYFSGTINPYSSAARFNIYKDTIEVRKFWDTEGINIDF